MVNLPHSEQALKWVACHFCSSSPSIWTEKNWRKKLFRQFELMSTRTYVLDPKKMSFVCFVLHPCNELDTGVALLILFLDNQYITHIYKLSYKQSRCLLWYIIQGWGRKDWSIQYSPETFILIYIQILISYLS